MNPERYEFLRSLQKNDVIRLRGRLRVIRKVEWVDWSHKRGRGKRNPQFHGWFTFLLLRCSWTTRAYTIYTSTDLGSDHTDIELVARNFRQKVGMEKIQKLEKELSSRASIPPMITCCDIKGMY